MVTHKEILIVDDEPGHRSLINKKLRASGYHTVLAQNGQEALVALWEKRQISVVLLDVRLPVINGLNIFEIIRKEFPDKRIIVTSVLEKDEQRFLIKDADDYYYKCDDLSILIEKIDLMFNGGMTRSIRGNEKRTFKRLPVNVLANCEFFNRSTHPSYVHFLSYTKDLSTRGGRFIFGENIKVGQHFLVSLELPVNSFPLLIDCEAMWVKKLIDFNSKAHENYEAGFRFIKLDSPYDEEKLKNYLNCV